MSTIATTPEPPYYAVIFTNLRTNVDEGYSDMAQRMVALAAKQPGFLGFESARDELGISVSYWQSLDAIQAWKQNIEHLAAQQLGREHWYSAYCTRIARVEREYRFSETITG